MLAAQGDAEMIEINVIWWILHVQGFVKLMDCENTFYAFLFILDLIQINSFINKNNKNYIKVITHKMLKPDN